MPADLNGFLSYLETILELPTVEKIWSFHLQKMSEYGFDRLVYGVTRSARGHYLGEPADFQILSNFPADFMSKFIDEKLFADSPMVIWASHNVGLKSWNHVKDLTEQDKLTPGNKVVVATCLEHGIRAGASVSFRQGSAREKGSIGLCARADMKQRDVEEVLTHFGRELTVMNTMLHQRMLTLPFDNDLNRLTLRQREVLEWVGEGKTVLDIATIMALTPATVEKHLRLARRALAVQTTAQAVLKAAFQNQIYMVN
jgi:LuxR family transcriptional regulator